MSTSTLGRPLRLAGAPGAVRRFRGRTFVVAHRWCGHRLKIASHRIGSRRRSAPPKCASLPLTFRRLFRYGASFRALTFLRVRSSTAVLEYHSDRRDFRSPIEKCRTLHRAPKLKMATKTFAIKHICQTQYNRYIYTLYPLPYVFF